MTMPIRLIRRFLAGQDGIAALQFAFAAPVMFAMTFVLIDVGRLAYTHSSLRHAAEEGVRWAITHGRDNPSPASADDIRAVVRQQAFAIPSGDINIAVVWTSVFDGTTSTDPTACDGSVPSAGCGGMPYNTSSNYVRVQASYNFDFWSPFMSPTTVRQASFMMIY